MLLGDSEDEGDEKNLSSKFLRKSVQNKNKGKNCHEEL